MHKKAKDAYYQTTALMSIEDQFLLFFIVELLCVIPGINH